MELFYDTAQNIADSSLSIQKYLWSLVGIKPTQSILKYKPNHLLLENSNNLLGNNVKNMLSSFPVRLAGISGATAVVLSAYAAHKSAQKLFMTNLNVVLVLIDPNIDERRKKALDNGNKYHFYHTIALLLSIKSRHPGLTFALFTSGIILFSGSCYVFGFGNYEKIRNLTPFGGEFWAPDSTEF